MDTKDTPIRKSTVLSWIGIITGTLGAFTWVNSSYVTASEFKTFQTEIRQAVVSNETISLRLHLEQRNSYLEDKIFEINTKKEKGQQLTPVDESLLERYRREVTKNDSRINDLQREIERTRRVAR